MEKRKPAKTPAKNAHARKHCEQKHEKEQDKLPADLPNKSAAAIYKRAKQSNWRRQTASQFGGGVRDGAIHKIHPLHRPARKNQTGQCREPTPGVNRNARATLARKVRNQAQRRTTLVRST